MGTWEQAYYERDRAYNNVVEQLNRVARERDKERELRLAAEDGRKDWRDLVERWEDISSRWENLYLSTAAEELIDHYLEQLENEEE